MDCNQARGFMSEYIDGLLSPAPAAELEAHLEQCPECSKHLDDLRRTVDLLDDAYADCKIDAESLAARVTERCRTGASHNGVRTMKTERSSILPAFLRAAAALAIVAGAVVVFMMSQHDTPERPTGDVAEIERPRSDENVGSLGIVRGAVGARSEKQPRWSLARSGRQIRPGELLHVADDPASCARVALGSGQVVSIDSSGTVRFVSDRHLFVLDGRVHCEVTPGTPLTVETRHCKFNVKGTVFDVSTSPRHSRVAVSEGCVTVDWSDETFDVNAGDSCMIEGTRISLGDVTGEAPWLAKFDKAPENETLGRLVASVDGKDVPLSVKSHKVKVTIRDQIAYTLIDEEFHNHTGRRLEGTFYYPLPADASISRFAMYIGDTLMEGEMVERMRAREVYESIVRRRRDPALLEWMGGNQFKARVFPIEPESSKRVLLGYTQVLPLQGDTVRYTYPLKSEKLTKNPLGYLRIELDARSTPRIEDFDCLTHNGVIEPESHGGRIVMEARDYSPSRDFMASYRIVGKKAELFHVPNWREDIGGSFLAFISPRNIGVMSDSSKQAEPADILVMIDASASMAGDNFRTARRVASTYLNFLGREDRFNVLLYDIQPRLLFEDFLDNTAENRRRVARVLEDVEPFGASDLGAAISIAADAVPEGGKLLFIGDGVATIGETEPMRLLDAAAEALKEKNVTASTLAVGSKYSQAFVEGLPRQLNGTAKVISASRPVEQVVSELVEDSFKPVVTNLQLSVEGVDVHDVYPRELPNVLVGGQVIVAGRYDEPGSGDIILTGTVDGIDFRREIQADFTGETGRNTFVPRLWARRCMDDMLGRIGRGETELIPDVIDLSLRYKIMSPYTSMLVLETEQDYRRFGIDRRFTMKQWDGDEDKKLKLAEQEPSPGPGMASPQFDEQTEISSQLRAGSFDNIRYLGDRRGLGAFEAGTSSEHFARTWDFNGVIPTSGLEKSEEYLWRGEMFDDRESSLKKRLSSFMPVSRETFSYAGVPPAGKPMSLSGPVRLGGRSGIDADGLRYDGYHRGRMYNRGNLIYPTMHVPPEQPEPEAPDVDAKVRAIVESFTRGPLDAYARSKTKSFDADGNVTTETQRVLSVVGDKFSRKTLRDGRVIGLEMSDGETFYRCYQQQGYAAGRRANRADARNTQAFLPGFVGYSADSFLATYRPLEITSRDDDEIALTVNRSAAGRTVFTIDSARKAVLRVEGYYRRNDDAELKLSSRTVYDSFKTIGGRTVAMRKRTWNGEGRLTSETVFEEIELGEIDRRLDFAPPEDMLTAVYPLPTSAKARAVAEGAERPDNANFVLALALESERRFSDAAEALAPVLDARPEDAHLILFNGWLRAAAGQPGAIEKAITKSEKLLDESLGTCRLFYDLLGSVGLYSQRQAYIGRLFELSPAGSSQRVNWGNQLANRLVSTGDVSGAYELWQRILKEAPESANAWLYFAQFVRNRPEYADEAEAAFLKARELGRDVNSQLAQYYQAQGEIGKAIAAWRAGLRKNLSRWNFHQIIRTIGQEFGIERALKEANRVIAKQEDADACKEAMLGLLYTCRDNRWWFTTDICERLARAYPTDVQVIRELFQVRRSYGGRYNPMGLADKLLEPTAENVEQLKKQLEVITVLAQNGWQVAATRRLEELPEPTFEMTPEQEADRLMQVANIQQNINPAESVETRRRILELGLPHDDHRVRNARMQLFNHLVNTGETVEARKMLKTLADEHPKDPNLGSMHQSLVRALTQHRKADELAAYYADRIDIRPDLEYYLRIKIIELEADPDKPRETFEKLSAMTQKLDAAISRGEEDKHERTCFEQAGRALLSVAEGRADLLKKIDDAVARRSAEEDITGDIRWTRLHARLLRSRADYDTLKALLKRLAGREQDGVAWLRRLASVHAATKDYESAIEVHERLLEKNADDLNALMMLHRLHEAAGHSTKARDYWAAWVDALPENEAFLHQAAARYSQQKRSKKAISVWEKLMEFTPNPGSYAANLANEYSKIGDKYEAAMVYVKATRPAPRRTNRPYHQFGNIWPFIKEERTFERFAAALDKEIDAADQPVRRARLVTLSADIHAKRGDKSEAARRAESALQLVGHLDETGLRSLVDTLHRVEDKERVADLLAKAVEAVEEPADHLRKQLARELFKAGRETAGREIFNGLIADAVGGNKPSLRIELAGLVSETDPQAAAMMLDDIATKAPGNAVFRVLLKKFDIMAAAGKTFKPDDVIAAWRAAFERCLGSRHRDVAEKLVEYAAGRELHDAVFEGYKTLCRYSRPHNADDVVRRLAAYLRKHKLSDRAEAALRDCVEAARYVDRDGRAWREFGRYFAGSGDYKKAAAIWAEGLEKTVSFSNGYYPRRYLLQEILNAARRDKLDADFVSELLLEEAEVYREECLFNRGYSWPGYYWRVARKLNLTDQIVAKLTAEPDEGERTGEWYYRLGQVFDGHLSQPETALEYYKKAMDSPGLVNRAATLNRITNIYRRQEQWSKALETSSESLKLSDNYSRLQEHGFILAKLGREDEALEYYRKASQAAGFRRWAHSSQRQIGIDAFNAGLYDFAIKQMELSLRMYRFFRRVNNNVDNHHVRECYRYIAKCYIARGDVQKGVDQLLIGAMRLPENYRRYLLNDLMEVYRKSDKFEQLVAEYEREAERTETEKPLLRRVFGDIFQRRNNAEEALKHYKIAIEFDPTQQDIRSKVERILRQLNRDNEMIRQYRDWAVHEPKNIQVYRKWGDLLHKRGREGDAVRAWTTMLEAMPTEAESHRVMAQMYAKIDRHDDATGMWRKVIHYRPEEPQSYYGLAQSLVKSDKPQLALKVYADMRDKTWEDRFGNVTAEVDRRMQALRSRQQE